MIVFLCLTLLPFFSANDLSAEMQSRAIKVVVKNDNGSIDRVDLYDKMVAVIIGVDLYKNLPSQYHLNYAVSDARGVEKTLKERYNVSRIIGLYNQDANRENIMKVLLGELSTLDPDAGVIVYFAGHGITRSTQQGKLGYLIPYDGSLEGNEMYKNISMQQIKSDISPLIPSKHVLYIIDACFGGLLLGQRAAGLKPSHDMAYLREITREPVRQIITAGGENEAVLDGGLYGHSVFTGRLIEALEMNNDFITAKELGVSLQRKVFSDAASNGHKQRPQVGEIYGTGDFVFIPDVEKLRKDVDNEVAQLESEMNKLKKLKEDAEKRKNKAELREIERQHLLKAAALKQAKRRKETSLKEAELRRKMDEDEKINAMEMKKRDEEREKRLAYLKGQTNKIRMDIGSPIEALGMENARDELMRLNNIIEKLENDYQFEFTSQIAPIKKYYGDAINKIKAVPPRDEMFESKADYNLKLKNANDKVDLLKKELLRKQDAIYTELNADLIEKKDSLINQKEAIIAQNFPVDQDDIKWTFNKYDIEKEKFSISLEIKGLKTYVHIPIPKANAKEYYHNPDLLVAKATLSLNGKGEVSPNSFSLLGPGGEEYKSANLSKNYKFIKLTIDSGFNMEEVQLAEIEFLQEGAKIPVIVESYSSEYYDKRWSHNKIIDGNTDSSWANGDSDDNNYPHWFILSVPDNASCSFDSVRLYTGTQRGHTYRLSAFSLYGSSDKNEWSHLLTGKLDKNAPNNWETFYPDPKGSSEKKTTGLLAPEKNALFESGLAGTWEGRGCQGSGSCWTIKINIPPYDSKDSVGGTIEYPSLRCKARLEFVRWENATAVFRERYTKKGNCVDNGWLFLTPKDTDTLDYAWAWPDGRKDAYTEVALIK